MKSDAETNLLADNPGAFPDIPTLPDTPENRAKRAELERQINDPSTPLGAFFAEFDHLSTSLPVTA